MRLFLAIELPETVRAGLHASGANLAPSLNFPIRSCVAKDNIHLTLRFLGEIDEQTLTHLCATLKQARYPMPFNLQCAGIECLPHRGPVRIVSAGFSGDLGPLHELYGSIEQACEQIGLPRERRPYHPHATFVRLRFPLRPSDRSLIQSSKLPHSALRSFNVAEFALFQSHLEPSGARYVPLARFKLTGGDE